jgi:hypothetical protein
VRDYLFDARTGYYVVDKPTGWEWGSAELDPAAFTIVRTEQLTLPNGEAVGASPAFGRRVGPVIIDPRGIALPGDDVPNVRPLQLRHFKLEQPLEHSGEANIFNDAGLAECPEAERILPSRFINLTNGDEYGSEDDMWGSVSDGDGVVMQGWGDTAQRPMWALKIVSVENKQAEYQKVGSIEEAEQWLS